VTDVAVRHLVLVGLMGVGKTTVGRRCAARLGRPFVDTDDLVVAASGMDLPTLFAAEGEDGFRARERLAVADACASPEPLVLATGGGAVLDAVNRRALRETGCVVWLRAPAPVLAERVGAGVHRPLLASDPVTTLHRLEVVRAPAYEAAAHERVDTDGRTPDEVTDAVLEVFEACAA
jgi:shikimate kinase